MINFTAFSDRATPRGEIISSADGVLLAVASSNAVVTSPTQIRSPRLLGAVLLVLASSALLAACGSVGAGVGVGIPVGPFSIGVGMGSGGLSAGVGTGWGPLGVGVGVNQRGQVTGNAGVGVSTGVGGASVGAGVGTSTVLHDPAKASAEPAPMPVSPEVEFPYSTPAPQSAAPTQWRDAQGQIVPSCKIEGRC